MTKYFLSIWVLVLVLCTVLNAGNNTSTDIKPIPRPDQIYNGKSQDFIHKYNTDDMGFNYELFESTFPPLGWQIFNPDDGITFEHYDGANGPSFAGSKSVMVEFYSYSSIGATDTLYTAVYTASDSAGSIKFDYAHAEYPNYGPDRLIVKLSVDGGLTFRHTIFDKSGNDLATVPATSANFVPSANDWESFSYSLSGLVTPGDQVVLAFISISGYSNNLFIDNLLIGNQFGSDVAVAAINNIIRDTTYTIGLSTFDLQPNVTVTNMGRNDIADTFSVVINITPGVYTSSRPVYGINSGQSQNILFDTLSITPGMPMDITIYSELSSDENTANDTLQQYSLILAGTQRSNVLLQQWTNASCAPCASYNPTIDAFVESNYDSIVPVKYHVWWPGAGDPMYQYNTSQIRYRTNYYGVGGVPHVIMGGEVHPVYPYTTPGSLPNAYNSQMSKATPIELSVINTATLDDSVQVDIMISIISPLVAGEYYLRVESIERVIEYATAPGSNGERIFWDVFRRAYPDVQGILIPTTLGNYNYSLKYAFDPVWGDSIYTVAYIQDDVSKKVWASDKGDQVITELRVIDHNSVVYDFNLQQNFPNPFNPVTTIKFGIASAGKVNLSLFNLLGQQVTQLVNKKLPPGYFQITWDGTDQLGNQVASGVYFYSLETSQGILFKKLIYVK